MSEPGPGPIWEWSATLANIAATRELAVTLGGRLRAGDLLVLSGELGAGKTTFTQGLGSGLGVRAGIISPTFVLVRIHPALATGPDLVHVDAYRLDSAAELDDIDLENTMDTAVTVVEWGAGKVEHLSDSRLEILMHRTVAGRRDVPGLADDACRPDDAVRGAVSGLADVPGLADDAGRGSVVDSAPHSAPGPLDFSESELDDEARGILIRAYGPRWDGGVPQALADFADTTSTIPPHRR